MVPAVVLLEELEDAIARAVLERAGSKFLAYIEPVHLINCALATKPEV